MLGRVARSGDRQSFSTSHTFGEDDEGQKRAGEGGAGGGSEERRRKGVGEVVVTVRIVTVSTMYQCY